MAGGAPAGIIKLPGDELCCTTRAIIRIITMRGNKSTAPSGTDIFELPLSRIRLLKKDNFGMNRSFSLVKSLREGSLGDEGILFIKFPTNPMVITSPRQQNQGYVVRGGKKNISGQRF